VKRIEASLALIQREKRWFLQRRDSGARILAGRWEFPGGKCEPGETPLQTILRELQEELGWKPEKAVPIATVIHQEVDTERVFHLFRCDGAITFSTQLAWGWFTHSEILALPIPPSNTLLLPFLDPRGGSPASINPKNPPLECP